MSTAQDKQATVEFITDGVYLKKQAGDAASASDTGETKAMNVAAVIRLNGSDSTSTGNRRELVILVGETAPTSKYADAAPGSIFILAGASAGAMYIKTDATTWTIVGSVT